MKETEYIMKVDEMLKNNQTDHRAELLHQNTPYTDLLDFGGHCLTPENRCERAARILMFHLGEAYFYEKLPKLQDCFDFIYGALLYLECMCREEDKTYNGLLKLSRLDQETRDFLKPLYGENSKYESELGAFRKMDKTPFAPDKLEEILLSVTDWSWEDLSA